MQVKLTVVGGKANKREVVINLPASIGRSREADLTVGHRMISRKHCETYLVDGVMMIRDVGSLNGTYVKGRRVREAPLLPHQKFTIGPITFRVSYEFAGDRKNLPPIVPAEPAEGKETTDVPRAEAAQPRTRPVKDTPVARPAAAKKADKKQPPAASAEEEPDFQIVEEPEPDFRIVEEEDEPDFRIVEEDDDFELSLQEDLGHDSKELTPVRKDAKHEPHEKKPAAKKASKNDKPAAKTPAGKAGKEEPEIDPEDQLLDDFLNDLK